MITAVRIINLRSLTDTGFIAIKPITLLLGANSTGKSTFLRSFPLFTQSVNKDLRGPISWFDDSLVDFGDYNTALNKYAEPGETIRFEYIIKQPFVSRRWDFSYHYNDYHLTRDIDEAQLSLALSNDSKGTFINSVCIIFKGLVFKMHIPDRMGKVQFKVNGQIIDMEQTVKWNPSVYNSILPSFEVDSKDLPRGRFPVELVVRSSIFEFVRQRSDKRLRKLNRVDAFVDSWTSDKTKYLSWLKYQSPITSFRNNIKRWRIESQDFKQLFHMIALEKMLHYWSVFDSEIALFYSCCSYIAPTRAEANRYYRTQGLQISDIDSYGKNLPEFISSLTPSMANSYNQYTQKVLGVKVRTKAESGHQCIMVSNEKGEFNITDVGFGYSQILPIVTKLWYSTIINNNRNRRIVAFREELDGIILMEQPELHLHPAFQAKIADAFINSVKGKSDLGRRIRLIVETHSDTILNRIGRRVREGSISPDDVNIVLFEKGIGETVTCVKQTSYNQKGQIMQWPYGFFDPLED